eukprot:3770238-Prymnesium_polylepis.1
MQACSAGRDFTHEQLTLHDSVCICMIRSASPLQRGLCDVDVLCKDSGLGSEMSAGCRSSFVVLLSQCMIVVCGMTSAYCVCKPVYYFGVSAVSFVQSVQCGPVTYRFTWGRGRRTLAQDSG